MTVQIAGFLTVRGRVLLISLCRGASGPATGPRHRGGAWRVAGPQLARCLPADPRTPMAHAKDPGQLDRISLPRKTGHTLNEAVSEAVA